MKGIFFCESFNPYATQKSGIEKKIFSQITCLSKIMPMKLCYADVPGDKLDRFKFLLPFIKSIREINWFKSFFENDIDYKNYNFIYIRKPSLSIYFFKILYKIKQLNPSIFIVIEIPTYPYYNEYKGLGKLMILKSIYCEKKLKEVIDKVITFSNDKEIWGISCLNIPNCVDYSCIEIRRGYEPINNTIRFTFVADFMYWHGADRIIKSIKNYKGNYNLVLNIVGGGKEISKLKKLACCDNRIIFHGFLTGKELDEIFSNTDIAIDSLGRHRSGVYYNSSLKGKEYSARGIPIMSGIETELDHISDYDFYYRVSANEDEIIIDDIVAFYEKMLQKYSPSDISKIIRMRTYNMFDFEYGFKKPIESLIKERIKKSK